MKIPGRYIICYLLMSSLRRFFVGMLFVIYCCHHYFDSRVVCYSPAGQPGRIHLEWQLCCEHVQEGTEDQRQYPGIHGV